MSGFLGLDGPDVLPQPAAVILGVPLASPYPGRAAHATQAPAAVRAASSRLAPFVGHLDFDTHAPFAAWHARVADGGDVSVHPEDEAANRSAIEARVAALLAGGVMPIILGGDDSVPIPVLAAYASTGPVSVLHIDAHLDFRDEVEGHRFGYSSPMRRASEMPWVRRIVHVGQRGVGSARPADVEASRVAGNQIVTARSLAELGPQTVAAVLDRGESFVIVLDVDGIDPTEMPAVRAPVASGPSLRVVTDLCVAAAHRSVFRGLVVTELEPSLDINGIAARNAVRLICRVLDAALGVS